MFYIKSHNLSQTFALFTLTMNTALTFFCPSDSLHRSVSFRLYFLLLIQAMCVSLRSCAGPRAGDGCAVCRSPAWVKDIQINRQLSTIVELFGGLESLLNPAKQPGVEACLQAGEWVPEAEHEAGDGARRSRINRCSLLPPLFDGCFFFLLGSFKAPSRDELAALLREGGGQLLSRQPKPDSDVTQTLSAAAYHALPGSDQTLCTQYIIFDPRGPHRPPAVRRGKVWSAPFTWLIECVAAFALLPLDSS
uniref:BRCT domain-containing protein n=1 Tax=Salarias fasciatus TaxID=181472 RepID=A0A672GMV9_SALFA